jgi:hypothetical protein
MPDQPVMQGEIKRNIASLVGGILIGLFVLGLWILLVRDLGFTGAGPIVLGLVIAAAAGLWVRLADL